MKSSWKSILLKQPGIRKKPAKILYFFPVYRNKNYFLFLPFCKEIRHTFFYFCRLPFSQLAVGNLQQQLNLI